MINETEFDLLEQFADGEITDEKFIHSYPVNILQNKNYFIDLIDSAIKDKNGERLDLLLKVIASLEMYQDFNFQSLYRDLIKVNWHRMHEELVDALDKTSVNEDSFIHVLKETYAYHMDGIEDFMVPIWSKCLWALYQIRSRKGENIIRHYVGSEYTYLKATANILLSKWAQ